MKNKDFAALKRTEILNRMNAAVAENDSEAFSKAYLELCQDIEENVLEQAKELVNQSDMNVLAQRGVRQLTSAEREYYEKVIDAMKSSDPKQALNNIETVFPETIIDSVFEELTTNHPLLSKLNATTVTGLTRMMLKTHITHYRTKEKMEQLLLKSRKRFRDLYPYHLTQMEIFHRSMQTESSIMCQLQTTDMKEIQNLH